MAVLLMVLIVWSCIWIDREYFIHIENVDFYVITLGNAEPEENIETHMSPDIFKFITSLRDSMNYSTAKNEFERGYVQCGDAQSSSNLRSREAT